MWKNMVEPDRPQTTMWYGACALHATDTLTAPTLLYQTANFWQRATWTSNLNYYYYYYHHHHHHHHHHHYSVPNGLWPLPACFLFTLYSNPLQPCLSIFYMVFLFSFFLSIETVAICFGVLWFCILSAWPYHLSRKASVNFTISSFRNMSLFSRLCLYSSVILLFAGTHIFPRIFLSDILSSFVASALDVQASVPLGRYGSCWGFYMVLV